MELELPPVIHEIEALFEQHGSNLYEGARQESVSALEHALQCAQLAEWADADASLVAAALLHDLGHFLAPRAVFDSSDIDDTHEERAMHMLTASFGPAVTEPIRLHVAAKRYLVAKDKAYAQALSPASQHSLILQGGPMTPDEALAFEALPYSEQAARLRCWDDLAKTPGKRTPPLRYYLALLAQVHGPADTRVGMPGGAWD